MVIGIDIRVLGNPIKSGIEEYTENLLAHMLSLDSSVKYKLFFSSYSKKLPDYDWLHLPNVELRNFNYPNRLLFYSSRFFNRPFVDKMIGGADIFFSPHFFLTSLSPECRRVTTFHDLSYLRFPEFFSLRQRLWHQFEMRPAWQSRFSEKVIAVSESTKKDIVEKYNINPDRISVIYSGVAESMKQLPRSSVEEFRNKAGLPKRFIFFMGKLEPRKNVVGLIGAFNLLKGDPNFSDLELVIAGAKGWLYRSIFEEALASPYGGQIRFVDQIKDEERVSYYNTASAFVYPSFFEGFGLPPLEAMACGTPVITASNSSMPEVVADAGLLVDSKNITEIAFAVKHVLADRHIALKLSKQGLLRAKHFSWKQSAESTLSLLTE